MTAPCNSLLPPDPLLSQAALSGWLQQLTTQDRQQMLVGILAQTGDCELSKVVNEMLAK